MRKNVAGQHVAGQVNSRTDGAPLTSAVSVFITIDGGTQTAGGGTLAHKGNGQWDYAPTQAETNGNHLAFAFTHATGVNQVVNVYPVSFDPHDTAGLGLSRLDAAVSSRMATFTLPTNFAALAITAGGLVDITQAAADKAWGSAARLLTAGTNIVLAKGTGITGFNDLDAAGVRGAVGLAAANLDTQLGDLPTGAEIADAVWDELLAGHAGLGSAGLALATVSLNIPLDAAGTRAALGMAAPNLDTQLGAIAGYVDVEVGEVLARLTTARAANLDNLDAVVSTRLATAAYTAPDNAGITAIKSKTDSLNFTVAGKLDVNVLVINGVTVQGIGQAPPNHWHG